MSPFGSHSTAATLLSLHLLILTQFSSIETVAAFYDFAYYRNERSGEEGIPRTSLTVAVIEYAISGEGAEVLAGPSP